MKNGLARVLVAALVLIAAACPSLAQFADQRVYAGTSGGSSAAYTITIGNYGGTAIPGIPIRWVPHVANPSTATVAIAGGSGAINLCKPSPSGPVALTGGELQANQPVEMVYNATAACQVVTSSVDSTSASIIVPPQGYLTPCPASSPPTGCTAGQITPTGDVLVGVGQSVTGIVYVPMAGGNQIPIWNGSRFVVFQFPQLTLTLTSSHIHDTIYDVCVFSNAGTPTIVSGPAWSSSTAGSSARGSGAGTTQLARVGGLYVNAVTMTGINGANTYSNIPVNQCTYVASFLVDGTDGQLTFSRTWGQNRKWSIYNNYNAIPILMQAGDPTSSWLYNINTIRASNGNSANKIISLVATPDNGQVDAYLNQQAGPAVASSTNATNIGVGWNVTNAFCGKLGTVLAGGTGISYVDSIGRCIKVPVPGRNDIFALEQGGTGATNTTFFGTVNSMLLAAQWKG